MKSRFLLLLSSCALSLPALQAAETTAETPAATRDDQLSQMVVTGRLQDLVGIANSASEGYVGATDLASRPLLRPGEIVENIPGVIITQHSGSGKANQYFLRGFNLDHGTDLAISLDDVPVNMRTHAHGQGYSDLNFLIPELVEDVSYKKGPYYADVGDFGAAGDFNIQYYDKLPTGIATFTGGQFGYARTLLANNLTLGAGNLVYAVEYEHNDGPWDVREDASKTDALLRYTVGEASNRLTVTAQAYHNNWHSTDQVPQRALDEGIIGRFGALDPSDGGDSSRYSLSADWQRSDDHSATRILLYGLYYDLDLFSNFTYFLDDPIHGDQFEQKDRRTVFGAKASQIWNGELWGRTMQTTVGLDVRSDDILNGLYHTESRRRLSTTHQDRTFETSVSPYLESQIRWTDWFRTVAGLREDIYWLDVRNLAGGNSGSKTSAITSPKLSLILGPWAKTEFYLNGGLGFHSNDARGVVARQDSAPALVRAKGAEIGVRTSAVPNLQSSLTFWALDIDSELTWAGDAGANEPSGPTRRYGVEFANYYALTKWLTADADFAWSHSRYRDHEPEGNYVPEALVGTIDIGLSLHDVGPFFANARARYFGPRPLTQDGRENSSDTFILYAEAGYKIDETWTVSVEAFNLLNARNSDIDYFYTSRLRGEPAAGVNDTHTHPVEPREIRFSVTARF